MNNEELLSHDARSSMLRVENVDFCYGTTRALADVSFATSHGVFALLGPNGAGKTTLLSLLATLATPSSGSMRFGEHDLAAAHGRKFIRPRMGYLPQQCGFFPDFSAEAFVKYIAVMRGVPKHEAEGRVDTVLRQVGLTRLAGKKIRKLSGGQRQRVGIAQAIVNRPELLLLDEPTVGLDPEQRFAFRALIQELGTSAIVLLSTHLVDDIEFVADEVLVLAHGQVRFIGTPQSLGMRETATSRGNSVVERGYSAVLGAGEWSDGDE